MGNWERYDNETSTCIRRQPGQGSEPSEPVQSLEVLSAPPQAGIGLMPLYNNDWQSKFRIAGAPSSKTCRKGAR